MNKTMENLERMVGYEFDYDEIIAAFDSEEEITVNEIIGQESNFEGQGLCKCYNAYEDIGDGEVFEIYVNTNNEIVSIA